MQDSCSRSPCKSLLCESRRYSPVCCASVSMDPKSGQSTQGICNTSSSKIGSTTFGALRAGVVVARLPTLAMRYTHLTYFILSSSSCRIIYTTMFGIILTTTIYIYIVSDNNYIYYDDEDKNKSLLFLNICC